MDGLAAKGLRVRSGGAMSGLKRFVGGSGIATAGGTRVLGFGFEAPGKVEVPGWDGNAVVGAGNFAR